MGEFAGQPVSRFEDPRLLRGGGRYVDDMVLPHMAYGYVLRSPHAHTRIVKIDTRDAKAAPGVLAVLTGADWEASGWGDLPVPTGIKRRDGSPSYKPRFPALVTDRVRVGPNSTSPRGETALLHIGDHRLQVEHALGVAAEDIALRLFREERQIIDRRR
jgi:CO/xanthine dehydrogenase Mo-binding subunit